MCKNYWSKMYQDFATHIYPSLTHSKIRMTKIKTVRNCKNIFWSTVESCVDDWNIQHSQNNLSHHVLLFNIICLLLVHVTIAGSGKVFCFYLISVSVPVLKTHGRKIFLDLSVIWWTLSRYIWMTWLRNIIDLNRRRKPSSPSLTSQSHSTLRCAGM